MSAEPRTCPDCPTTLQGTSGSTSRIPAPTDSNYALSEAKRGFWTGAYPVEGRVEALMYPSCIRIGPLGVAKET
jgi:hypothetical protein